MADAEEYDKTKILRSLLSGRLTVFVGAGLSVGPPSNLPLASQVAEHCVQAFYQEYGQKIPDDEVEDLSDVSQVASYFFREGNIDDVFLGRLVPWDQLLGRTPNPGHIALADLLLCGALNSVITTNYDRLLERAAESLGASTLWYVTDAARVNLLQANRPLVKVHGSADYNVHHTLWCPEQANHQPFCSLLRNARDWLRTSLRENDLLFVGYWSDWSYLNSSLLDVISDTLTPTKVWVVDYASTEALSTKAAGLWDWATQAHSFEHFQCTGHDFLKDLQIQFSKTRINQLLERSSHEYTKRSGSPPTHTTLPDTPDQPTLYELRRAIFGYPPGHPVRKDTLDPGANPVGCAIHLVLDRGGTLSDNGARLDDVTIRIVRGDGQLLHTVKEVHHSNAPLDPTPPDYVICAGGQDDGNVPQHVVRSEHDESIVRGAETQPEWLTLEHAFCLF